MDTRSVVRSRRRSTRLTGQPPQDERVKRSTTGKRRDSGHNTPARNSSDSSREGSCAEIDSTSKASSSQNIHVAIHVATPNTNTTKPVVKADEEGLVLPLFPNLRSSRAKATQSPEAETDHIAAPLKDSVDTSTDNAIKGQVSTKWVKTERGSIMLASDSEAEGTKNNANKRSDEAEEGQNASSAMAGRRSRRLSSMTPDVRDETVEVEPRPSRHTVSKTKATATTASACVGTDPNTEQEYQAEPDLQDLSIGATSEHDPTTRPTHQDEVPIHDGKAIRPLQKPDILQNASAIPELVADIEKIVLSSPMAGEDSADDGTRGMKASTPAKALKKRAPATVATKSRTLRSSSRSVDSASKTGKGLGSEQTDSESSQLDGAFDDSIRGRRKKKNEQAPDGTADTAKPIEPRGTKRGAEELSQDEGSTVTPRLRQRQKPNSDGSKPEVDLSSANPIETATSRDAFSVDHPGVEAPVNIGEFARRSDEPANPVMLAHMLSTHPERAVSDIDSNAADDGSEGVSQRLSPEFEPPKCADCGRSPERYLVCAKCKEAIYCGKYCQIWNWPQHKNRCVASDETDQAEIDLQEAYLGEMWADALKLLEDEKLAGGTLESVLLGEAVRHSHTRLASMGQANPRGFVGFDVDASQSALNDAQSLDSTRAMSLRLAQAAMEGDE